jgi:hypothetical protein
MPISGVNVKSGEIEATTGALGFYTLELQPGEHELEFSGAGIISTTSNIVVGMENLEGGAADMRILPELEEDQWFAVLRWGEESKSCEIQQNYTYLGDILKEELNVESASECSDLCQAETDCKVWSYGKMEGQWFSKRCFLKTEGAKANGAVHPCCDSGMRCENTGVESKTFTQMKDLDVVLSWGSTIINRGFRGAWVNNVGGVLEMETNNGFGPETAYFGGIGNCTLDSFYCDVAYKVNAYAGGLASSKAVVKLYHGSEVKAQFGVADCAGAVADDSWWHVFTIDAKTNQLKWTCKDGPELISLHQSPNKMEVEYKSYKGPFPGRFFRHSRHPKKVQSFFRHSRDPKKVQKGKRKNHAIRSMAPSPVEMQA